MQCSGENSFSDIKSSLSFGGSRESIDISDNGQDVVTGKQFESEYLSEEELLERPQFIHWIIIGWTTTGMITSHAILYQHT